MSKTAMVLYGFGLVLMAVAVNRINAVEVGEAGNVLAIALVGVLGAFFLLAGVATSWPRRQ